jgi:hypothetical protein
METDNYKELQAGLTSGGSVMTDRQLLYYQWLDAWRDADANALIVNSNHNLKIG